MPGLAEVVVPELEPERPRPAFAPRGLGLAGAVGAEHYAEACLRRLAVAPAGRRHRAILATGCRLFEIAQAGQLDPTTTVARNQGRGAPLG